MGPDHPGATIKTWQNNYEGPPSRVTLLFALNKDEVENAHNYNPHNPRN